MYFSKKKQLYKQTKDHLIHKCFLFIYLVYDYMIYFYSLHYSNYYMIHKCIKFVTISDLRIGCCNDAPFGPRPHGGGRRRRGDAVF